MNQLKKTPVFAFGGVGFTGRTSEGEKDFRVIYAQKQDLALKDFEEIYASGNSQARSYALVGIRELSPSRFAELKRSLTGSHEAVMTMSGCILSKEPLQRISAGIEVGRFDFWLKKGQAVKN